MSGAALLEQLRTSARRGSYRWLGAAVLVSLVASSPATARQKRAADGFRFGTPEYVKTDFRVVIVEHESAGENARAAMAAGATLPEPSSDNTEIKLKAWSRLRDGSCEIHVVKATVSYEPEWLGHELSHCIYGRWHR